MIFSTTLISNNALLDYVLQLFLIAVALIGSIILHELAHGYVALINGDKTAKYAGRLSFNPAKHFDLQGLLMMLVVHVGYARPVPINSSNFKRKRLGLFTVSIAGIVVNFLLSFIFTLFFLLLDNANLTSLGARCITLLLFYIATLNLSLAFFNLLPLFPLDGYNILESIVGFRNSLMRFLRNYGAMILLALVLLSIIVSRFGSGFPFWLDLLGTYLRYTANFVFSLFVKFWSFVFGF